MDPGSGELYFQKELAFLFKVILVIVLAAGASFAVLYGLIAEEVDQDYGSAFLCLAAAQERMVYYIGVAVIVQLALSSAMVYFIALMYSHKIAGPMYRIKVVARQYLAGETVRRVAFRQSDFFHSLGVAFTEYFQQLNDRKEALEHAGRTLDEMDFQDEERTQRTVQEIRQVMERLVTPRR